MIHAFYWLVIADLFALLYVIERESKKTNAQVERMIVAFELLASKLRLPPGAKAEMKPSPESGDIYWANTHSKGPHLNN